MIDTILIGFILILSVFLCYLIGYSLISELLEKRKRKNKYIERIIHHRLHMMCLHETGAFKYGTDYFFTSFMLEHGMFINDL